MNNAYTKRCLDFFLNSIHDLKKQSGGQRWNAICEDATDLFFHNYPKRLGKVPIQRERFWQLLFDASLDKNDEIYGIFTSFFEEEELVDLLFLLLQSLLDPPVNWWKNHF